MTSFYFFMSLMEGRTLDEAIGEVKSKFVPTYKVSVLCAFGHFPWKNMSFCHLLFVNLEGRHVRMAHGVNDQLCPGARKEPGRLHQYV